MWRMPYSIALNLHRLPKLVYTMHRMVDRPDLYTRQDGYDYVRYIITLMKKTGHMRTQCFGAENLPGEGGYLLCPNHQGKYDAYSIVDVHERAISLVMDREQSYHIFVSEIVDVLKGKRMDIHDVRHGLTIIRQVAKELEEGIPHVIFPEGGYDNAKRNTLWEFKPGCFKAATKAKVPIIPTVLVDSYKVYNSWHLGPITTQVHYLKPIPYEEYQDLNTHQIAELVKGRIQEKLTELGY